VNQKRFFAELKRRKVYKIAIGYVVGGWALAQGVAQVFPVFDVPNWAVRLIVLLIVLGFPVALCLSWFFDLTRYGIVRTPDLSQIERPRLFQRRNCRGNSDRAGEDRQSACRGTAVVILVQGPAGRSARNRKQT
jgi:hypothetical protein